VSEPGFASLGPTLLARKGGAKPAMRPQLPPLVQDEMELAALADEQLEDLGWNDMGDGESEGGANIVPINAGVAADDLVQGPGPVVRRQQRRLEERVLADAAMTGPEDREPEYDVEDEEFYGDGLAESDDYEPVVAQLEPVSVTMPAAPKQRVPAVQAGRRAAFTLRLDTDRHLKLRLAATMQGISAQVLVTEALDRLLAEFDDLDVIATHLKRH
jgi:hypothetical protein